MLHLKSLVLLLLFSISTCKTIFIKIDTNKPIATTANSFLGCNIDSASLYQDTRLNFKDTDLINLSKRLANEGVDPMVLRIGGSSADDLTTFVNNSNHGHIYVTTDYWDELIQFVNETGFHLVWDLNMRIRHINSTFWDPQDAIRLLNYMRDNNQLDVVHGFQLGNEPGHYQTRNHGIPTAKQHGLDFITLSNLLDEYYKPNQRPRMQGPDVCFGKLTDDSPCADTKYFRQVLQAAQGSSTLSDITVHSYGMIGPVTTPTRRNVTECYEKNFLNSTLFRYESVVPAVAEWMKIKNELAPKSNLVLSETATTGDGGCKHLSNRFLAGFYFVDILGVLGDMGVHQVYRQDLVGFSGINGGSSYALTGVPGWFNHNTNGKLLPNPDYFTARLYRKLVGAIRLSTNYEVDSDVRALRTHAACAVGGGIVITYINPSNESLTVELEDQNSKVELYILTSGQLTDSSISLNGVILNANSILLPITGTSNITLPQYSYGFIHVIDNNNLGICEN